MDTAHAAVRGSPSPLDPLSTSEIAFAAASVQVSHDLGAGMRFETVVLHEDFAASGPATRRAFVSFYDVVTSNLFEAVVSLTDGTVESCVPRPGARPRIAPDEFLLAAPGQGLPAWTEQDRSVADRPITVWHTFGHNHIVRPEDYPVQPAMHCGFTLQPFGFFDRNPTLDVPPSKSGHSCCA